MGKLEAIWIKRVKRGSMDPVCQAELIEQEGIVSNADQHGRRQVTIIEEEIWKTLMAKMNSDINPSARRANLMVSGLSLKSSRGRILNIGSCRIRINGETKPCERMDETLAGLKDIMWPDWNGGAYGEILNSGLIKIGDEVNWAG